MTELSEEEIDTILKVALKGKPYELICCEPSEKGYVPIGFLSVQKKICLKYKVDGHIEVLYLFLKSLPQAKFHQDVVTKTGAFRKEVLLFEKFFSKIFTNNKDQFPTCYLAKDNDKIVLKDLGYFGFTNVPLLQSFTLDHCKKAIESVAVMHTSSLAYEIKNKCKITNLLPVLMEETIFSNNDNHVGNRGVKVGINMLRNVWSKYLTSYSDELVNKVLTYMENLGKVMKPSSTYPNVLSHCDLWGNNMMFCYEGEKVKQCCILDFQLAALRPVTYDLLQIIYVCADKKIQEKNYNYLIEYYYYELKKNLTLENLDIQNILPWENYEGALKEVQPIVLSLAPLFLQFVLIPDEIIKEVLEDDQKYESYYLEDNCRGMYVSKAAEECPEYRSRVKNALIGVLEYFKESQNLH